MNSATSNLRLIDPSSSIASLRSAGANGGLEMMLCDIFNPDSYSLPFDDSTSNAQKEINSINGIYLDKRQVLQSVVVNFINEPNYDTCRQDSTHLPLSFRHSQFTQTINNPQTSSSSRLSLRAIGAVSNATTRKIDTLNELGMTKSGLIMGDVGYTQTGEPSDKFIPVNGRFFVVNNQVLKEVDKGINRQLPLRNIFDHLFGYTPKNDQLTYRKIHMRLLEERYVASTLGPLLYNVIGPKPVFK